MHTQFRQTMLVATLGASIVLTGCGGGGGGGSSAPTYGGATTPAAISPSNAEEIGTAAGEAATQAIDTQNANAANPFAVVIADSNGLIEDVAVALAQQLSDNGGNSALSMLPIGASFSYTELNSQAGSSLFCGGSVSFPDSFGQSSTLNGTITLNSLCYDDGLSGQVTISGALVFSDNGSTSSIRYNNVTVVTADGSTTFNATLECSSGSFFSCTLSSDFAASDGKVHRIADLSVSGNSTSGYNFSATFYHEDHGSVTVTTTSSLQVGGACYPRPDSGSLSYSSTSGSSGTISFNTDCSVSGTWNDGAASGSF